MSSEMIAHTSDPRWGRYLEFLEKHFPMGITDEMRSRKGRLQSMIDGKENPLISRVIDLAHGAKDGRDAVLFDYWGELQIYKVVPDTDQYRFEFTRSVYPDEGFYVTATNHSVEYWREEAEIEIDVRELLNAVPDLTSWYTDEAVILQLHMSLRV